MKRPEKAQTQKYRQLLIVLIVTFFVSPFVKATIGTILTALLLLYTILLIVNSFSIPRPLFWGYVVIAVMAFGLQLMTSTGWAPPSYNRAFGLVAQSIFALYLGAAAYWIGRDLFMTSQVTADTVRGGISVYLLIGFVWALLYGMVASLDATAFSQPLGIQESYLKALHFSFTTLTTLGYGDIVPVSEVALVLTNLEAIVGQIYVTVFIAILVGSYLSRRP